ncbi:MAG: ABC transporter ATP-binding protein [Hyphomicrobiales bacterium]|nr:ABC transporter ATP-binding protein [Hyphomicrobiales bacterium]
MTRQLLEVSQLHRAFGGLVAVSELSFHVTDGEVVSIIGPNGAGKTTAFNLITGVYPPTGGSIHFRGSQVSGMALHKVTDLGIGRTFQNLRIFPNLTVRDNVLVGMTRKNKASMLTACLRLPAFGREEARLNAEADRLIDLLELRQVESQLARNLPYGNQRRVEIARALASDPALLLLDEPAAGMNPAEIEELNNLIRRLRDEFGKTILIVEHHMSLVMEISDRIIVMDQGRKIAEGTPSEVRESPLVVRAYLGAGMV